VAGRDVVQVQERRIVPAAARVWALDPVPVRVLVVETTLVIAVSHRVRASVRAVTHLVAPDLAAALRDQPAVEEVTAWVAVASAVAAAAAVVAGVAAEVGDKELRETMNRISKQIAKLPD
jgi:hypothetical protein